MENLLPYAYSLLVFAIVAFLFILLGRIFLNVETIYFYEEETIQKNHANYTSTLMTILKDRGEKGWKLDRIEDASGTVSYVPQILIFVKTKTKFRLFG